MIVPRYYENLSVLHENTMPARAYYIPASKRMDKLWLALCFRAVRLDFHNNVVRS